MTELMDKLLPASVDILYEGMEVNFGIYCIYNGVPILLCNNTTLTESKLNLIKKSLKHSRNIFIEKEHHKRVIDESKYINSIQKRLEQKLGYNKLKQQAKYLMKDAASSGKVSLEDLQTSTEQVNQKIALHSDSAVIQCINGIREADEYIYVHSTNVGIINGLIGKWMGLDQEQIETLVKIGLVHDVGKLRIPTTVLNKPTRLTKDEFELIKMHPTYSYEILKQSGERNQDILEGAIQHHEMSNGMGYPMGLKINQIHLYSKITAVSDVYDAMVAKRAYKDAHSPFEILNELKKERYAHLDSSIVSIFLESMPKELTGKLVVLSNGAVGRVQYVNPANLKYPLINIDGDIISTDKNLHCICMHPEESYGQV